MDVIKQIEKTMKSYGDKLLITVEDSEHGPRVRTFHVRLELRERNIESHGLILKDALESLLK